MDQLETSDGELTPLILDCKGVGVELRDALTKVIRREDGNVFSNYRAAFLAVKKKGTLEELERRIARLRQEIGFQVQVISRRAIADISTRLRTTEVHTEQAAIGVRALSEEQKSNFMQLQDDARAVTDSILRNSSSVEGLAAEVADLRKLCEEIKSWTRSQPEDLSTESSPDPESFLETLKFRGMNDREETIPIAHVRTFEWLLMNPIPNDGSDENMSSYQQERKDLRKSLENKLRTIGVKQAKRKEILPLDTGNESPGFALQHWLRFESGIYWIWGKPGCGKSTLMKACGQEEKPKLRQRLEKLLREWSADHDLLIAKFFFFRPGSSLQKSHLGLLQSILYQLLSQKPSLINRAFTRGEQKEATARSIRSAGTDTSVWSVQDLLRAFQNIRDPKIKIFLHIDGIDEMDGSAKEIADILCDIATTNTNVKILTAGRWTPEFEKAFDIERSLNLHETTELDILHYTVDNLLQEDMFQLLSTSYNFTPENLTADKFTTVLEEIVSAAQGVFLWVKIVVDSLRQGVCHFENFEQLHSRLREYPKDLDKLYWFLFENIKSRYSHDAAFWLLAVYNFRGRRVDEQVTVAQLADAERFNPNDCLALDQLHELAPGPLHVRASSMVRRIRAQCPHFFEFRPPSATDQRVEFSHRTVLDFLSQDNVLEDLRSRINANRDPYLGIWAARFASLRRRPYQHGSSEERMCKFLSNVDTQGCEKLWKQLRVHAERSYWPFQEDRSSKRMKSLLFWGQGEHTFLTPTPTVRAWYNESQLAGLKRILSTQSNPITYLHVSGFITSLEGKEKFQPIPPGQNLTQDERMDIFMLHIIGGFAKYEEYPGRFWTMGEMLFPLGFDPNDSLWPRILEFFRISLIRFQSYLRLRLTKPADVERLAILPVTFHLVDVIIALLTRGADPNALCCTIWQDPDKSLLSALSLFIRFYEATQLGAKTDAEANRHCIKCIGRVDEVIQHLREVGGREIIVPPEDHNKDEVKLLTSKLRKSDNRMAGKNRVEHRKADTEHREE